jgi:hypothetical protein
MSCSLLSYTSCTTEVVLYEFEYLTDCSSEESLAVYEPIYRGRCKVVVRFDSVLAFIFILLRVPTKFDGGKKKKSCHNKDPCLYVILDARRT